MVLNKIQNLANVLPWNKYDEARKTISADLGETRGVNDAILGPISTEINYQSGKFVCRLLLTLQGVKVAN